MDEGSGPTTSDESIYGNDGTIYGATWVDGIKGYALSFDGTDDYIDCGNDTSLQITGNLTVEAMVKLNLGSNMAIVGKDGSSGDRGWYLSVLPDGRIRVRISGDGTDNAAYLTTEDTIESVRRRGRHDE